MQTFKLTFAIIAVIVYILIYPHLINRCKFYLNQQQTLIQQLTSSNG
ncbi:MAG: hypothetical protein ABSE91_02250 [Patescibacteria group bacterium]|jgi:hypothetical protein